MKTENDQFNVFVEGNYKNFEDFLTQNKDMIYDGVINSFKELAKTRKRKIKYTVTATVQLETEDVVEWRTEFLLSKSEPDILVEHIMPYFEEIENYEKCADILNLHKLLTKKKK